jgi:hypothetical protein
LVVPNSRKKGVEVAQASTANLSSTSWPFLIGNKFGYVWHLVVGEKYEVEVGLSNFELGDDIGGGW